MPGVKMSEVKKSGVKCKRKISGVKKSWVIMLEEKCQ